MKYKNTVTGAIIEVASVCNGDNWERIEDKPAKKKSSQAKAKELKGVNNNE